MGRNISLKSVIVAVPVDERIQNANQVYWSFEMALNVNENWNSLSGIFKDTVEVSKAELDKHVFALYFVDNIKECSDDHLSFFFIL